MTAHHRLLVLVLFHFLGCTAIAQEQGNAPLKVLFVGNSYTGVNDLPSLVVGLAEAAGGRKTEAGRHVFGGCTFERHVKETEAIEKIRHGKWNVVVLQEQSLRPVIDRVRMHEYARTLHTEIKKQGAETLLYLTWARQHIREMQEGADPASSPEYAKAMFQISRAGKTAQFDSWCQQHKTGLERGLNGAYLDIAQELGAGVAPVGIAWKKALETDPNLVLHRSDKSHPNPAGSYLAACVFYATLLEKNPVGLPGEIKKRGKLLVQLAPHEAKLLQEVAWETVKDEKQRGVTAELDLVQVAVADAVKQQVNIATDVFATFIIGQSYYPKWHGTLHDLKANPADLAQRYKQPIIVVEYSVPNIWEINEIVRGLPSGKGLGTFIWEPTKWRGGALFDQQGSTRPEIDIYAEMAKEYGLLKP